MYFRDPSIKLVFWGVTKMKHVLIEGWRGINQSIAMVNQYQLIELMKIDSVNIYHRDLPFHNPSWNEIDSDSGFPPDIKELIKSVPPPEWGWYDCVYWNCIKGRQRKPRPLADKIITYLITEFGLKREDYLESDIESYCKNDNFVVVPTQWVRSKVIDFGFPEDKVVLVPHGVNPDFFYPLPADERFEFRKQIVATPDHFVFLNVGAMTWNKGIDLLVRAFADIRSRHAHARLVLKDNTKLYSYGIDNVLQNLSAEFPDLITDEMRESIVLLRSTLSLHQMRMLYGSADAYISPYRAEGFNLPVIEAIACGTRAIVTAGGATDDFCRKETTLYIESNHVENSSINLDVPGYHLEPKLESLIEQMEIAIKSRDEVSESVSVGVQNLIRDYSWETCTRQLVNLF